MMLAHLESVYQNIVLCAWSGISKSYWLCFGCYVSHRVVLTFPSCQICKTYQQVCCPPPAQALAIHVPADMRRTCTLQHQRFGLCGKHFGQL